MRASITAAFLLTASPACADDLLLFGGQGHRAFLGCLNCSEFTPNSVWNDPPVIVDRTGNFYGRLSINEFISGSVCSSISGAERICRALKVMCADD